MKAINEDLADAPEDLNEDTAENDGWLWKMEANASPNTDEMMNEEAYRTFCEEQDDH